MSLRIKLALIFAFVAVATATAVAFATPAIVSRGFERIQGDAGEGRALGQGLGPGPRAGLQARRVQEETTLTIVLIATLAAAGASVLGFLVAGRLVQPLGRIRQAAAGVAAGDMQRRSGLADRRDEIGELALAFDAMADALERSDAARRQLFQDAAHELKTPLTVIDATTTAILDGVYAHDDRHLATIREQSHVLARIVDDLRTLSLAESGQLPLELRAVDVAEALWTVHAAFTASAELAGVTLSVAVPPASPVVRADPDRVRQILAALTDNALRHTPAGGAVVLRAVADGDAVRVSVEDSGSGVPAGQRDRVFERFFRADPARQRGTGTSGLGLAIARALAEAQGGSVGVGDAPTGGASFWVRLPAIKAT